jgi:ribosomal protein S18 acetylase RimI-like enzyme
MLSPLCFRTAQSDDIPALIELVESAYRGDASRVGWTTEADILEGQRIDAESLQKTLVAPDNRILIAEKGGEILACCHIEKQANGASYFGMFSVRPGLQGGGIGKHLLEEAERQVREDFDCVRMEMTVIDIRESLINFYERRGYLRTGIHKPFPYGDERFGIPKRDDLRFEILAKDL